uniref:MurR/RpiR family transcriptional regulator n=1 Tax=Anaerostipes sp. TaxID=1872530 RepID=UPI003FEF30C1
MKEVKVSENDELLELMNKMTSLNEQIIQKTKEQISVNILQKVIEQLDKTTFVDIIANNENAQIAEYASSNLCKIGKMATVYENDNKQISLGMNVPRDHVVIAVSKYGENINMLRAMRTLKKRHISVIAITGQGNETMKAVSDEMIYGVLDESVNSFTNLIFTTSVKYIFDLVYAVLFSKHYDSTIKHEEILLKLFERR